LNYDDFRQVWDEALRAAGLKANALFPQEMVDLRVIDRSYRIFIPYQFPDDKHPLFYISVELSWRWDALLSARFATTEEDLLTEMFGRSRRPKRTEPPYLRVDSVLHATIPMDGYYPAPAGSAWRAWAEAVASTVAPIIPAITAGSPDGPFPLTWCGEPEIRLSCSVGGQLYLQGVSISAFRLIRLPRQWDDPERKREPDPTIELTEFFQQVREALEAWEEALDELMTG
jgi:hypothetical protein